MDRYAVNRQEIDGLEVVQLIDRGARMEVWICPQAGYNCYRWRWERSEGSLELLSSPESPRELVETPFYFGNPVLFPFPNRIRDGRFRFGGRDVAFDINRPEQACAIHGLVCQVPWTLQLAGADEQGARASAFVRSADHTSIARQFPFPFELTLTYTLRDGALVQEAVARNAGREPLPMGYGIHPWFPTPLAPGGRRAACVLRVPARSRYELEECFPTGRVLPNTGDYALASGRPLGDAEYDDVFTDLLPDAGNCCTLFDPAAGVELTVRADAGFPHVVVFAPRRRSTICFEPYTCITDAVNLEERGLKTGLIVLDPGETWRGTIEFRAEAR